jgi:hypothetical protein
MHKTPVTENEYRNLMLVLHDKSRQMRTHHAMTMNSIAQSARTPINADTV